MSAQHSITRVLSSAQRAQAAAFVDAHHSYIRWTSRPSREMYWLLREEARTVGVCGFGSGFTHSRAMRALMAAHGIAFNQVANNIVLCLAGHRDRNAGTALLRLVRGDALRWWWERYGDQVRVFQTFILPPRTGALYRADNWRELGATQGGTRRLQRTRTLTAAEAAGEPRARMRRWKDGRVRWSVVVEEPGTSKVQLARLVTERERRAFERWRATYAPLQRDVFHS